MSSPQVCGTWPENRNIGQGHRIKTPEIPRNTDNQLFEEERCIWSHIVHQEIDVESMLKCEQWHFNKN